MSYKDRETYLTYHRAYSKAHPDIRKVRLDQTPRYRAKMEEKAGRARPELCELCERPPGKTVLVYDHDHATGRFRGWLCRKCNTVLGLVDDKAELLRILADYLETAGVRC